MSGTGRFDWPGLMRIGLGQLKLTPEVFWDLTPVELMTMAGQGQGQSMGRVDFEKLAAKFQDQPKEDET